MRHDDELLAFGMFEEIFAIEQAIAFLCPQIAAREQAREPAIGSAVFRENQYIGSAVAKDETAADRQTKSRCCFSVLTQGRVCAHDASKRIAIGDPQARKSEFNGPRHKFFWMRSATQKRKIRRHGQFSEGNFLGRSHGRNAPLSGKKS